MSSQMLFQYIREPGGLAHLRQPDKTETLCGLSSSEGWQPLSDTHPNDRLCRDCYQRVTDFVVEVMNNGR